MNSYLSERYREAVEAESRRIVAVGGSPIPYFVIEQCAQLQECFRGDAVALREAALKLIQPYRLTDPTLWAEHCQKLRASILKSYRISSLRRSRGLPFRSRRWS